jgi:ACS family hexuronate transporter-like MFS transporter
MKPVLRWKFLLMLFLGALISYLNRAALPVVASAMQKDLRFGPIEMGYVYGSFFVGYAAFNFIGGRAADKWGPYWVCGVSVAAWALFAFATAGAQGLTMVIASRLLFGAGQGPFGAAGVKLLSGFYKKHEAAGAIGTFSSGTPLGGAIAGPFVGYFFVAFDWRIALASSAALGLIWLVGWGTVIGRAFAGSKLHRASAAPFQTPVSSATQPPKVRATTVRLSDYLLSPLVVATAFGFFGYSYLLFFFLTWFPSYLGMAHHQTVQNAGVQTSIVWLLGFFGLLLGGRISDGIYRITGRALFSRKLVIVIGLTIAAICAASVTQISSLPSTIAAMSVSIFALYLTGPLYWAIVQDNVPNEVLGSVSGFIHTISNAAGFIGPVATGYIVSAHGSFHNAFLLAASIAAAGTVAVACFVRPSSSPNRRG